jgi:hypothetical protein
MVTDTGTDEVGCGSSALFAVLHGVDGVEWALQVVVGGAKCSSVMDLPLLGAYLELPCGGLRNATSHPCPYLQPSKWSLCRGAQKETRIQMGPGTPKLAADKQNLVL